MLLLPVGFRFNAGFIESRSGPALGVLTRPPFAAMVLTLLALVTKTPAFSVVALV